jgi:hypothetical protein
MQALIEHSPGLHEVCQVVYCHLSRRVFVCRDLQGHLHVIWAYQLCEAANDPVYKVAQSQ